MNLTLPAGETCTYLIEAICGLPSISLNDSTNFDIDIIDSDDDDVPDRTNLKSARPQKLNEAKGPKAGRFNPDEGKQKIYKSGKKSNKTEAICKKRYQQVSFTPLAGLNATVPASRLLQAGTTTPTYSLSFNVGTTDFLAEDAGTTSSALRMITTTCFVIFSALAVLSF